jgi:amino acid transporter
MTSDVINSGVQIQVERKRLKRELTLLPLFGLIYFTVCGGSFGIEPLVGWSGPGLALLLIFLTPLVFSLPNMLMVRELQSMMPVEGGYYHWIKQGFGPFPGYMAGWMNWVVSWVDVSIYPVLAAYYLGYFIPALRDGATIGGVNVSASVLSWLVALVLIWAISALQIRGARLAGRVDAAPAHRAGDPRVLLLDQNGEQPRPALPRRRPKPDSCPKHRLVCGDVELHGLGVALGGGR